MRFMRFFLCLVPLFFLILPASAEHPDAGERLQFADGLYSRGMYGLAVKEYETFLRDFPKSPKADVVYFRLGESYRKLGENLRAAQEYLHVFTNYPHSKFCHTAGYQRAKIYLDMGKFEVAIYWFDRLLKQKPSDDIASASLYFQGEAYLKSGKIDEATRVLQKIRKQYQSSDFYSLALLKLGEIYGAEVRGQRSAADPARAGPKEVSGDDARRYERALEMYGAIIANPVSERVEAEALFHLAELHFRQKNFKKSAEAYKKLLSKYPSDERSAEARLQAAWAAHNAGLYAEALQHVEDHFKAGQPIGNQQLASAKPPAEPGSAFGIRDAEWLYLKANCERQLIRNEEAIKIYSRLLSKYPDSDFANAARYEKVLVHYKMGRFREVVTEAGKIDPVPDIRKDVYWLLAESHAALKEEDKAIQYYRIIIKEFPKTSLSCDATYRLAHYLQTRGEYKEASRYYNLVAANFPDSQLAPRALFASASCLAQEKIDAEAVRDWSALIRKYPSNSLVEESLYQKAMSETRMQRDKEAIATFRDLLKKFPGSRFKADAHYWRGVLMKDVGRADDAEQELRSALKSSPRKELESEAKYHLAVILQERGKLSESANLFQSLLSSDAKDKFSPKLLRWLSEYRIKEKKFGDAITVAELLVNSTSEAVWHQIGWGLIGRAYFAQGNMENAEKAFRKSLDKTAITSFAAESALRLGEITLSADNFDEAAGFFKHASTLASDESMVGIRARAYAGLGATAKAKSDYETAARYFMSVAILYDDPELVPECLYEASNAFKELGRVEDGNKALSELTERYPKSKWAREIRGQKSAVVAP